MLVIDCDAVLCCLLSSRPLLVATQFSSAQLDSTRLSVSSRGPTWFDDLLLIFCDAMFCTVVGNIMVVAVYLDKLSKISQIGSGLVYGY